MLTPGPFWGLLDRLVCHIPWVDRRGKDIWDLSMIVSLAMPLVVAIAATVVLLATVA